jgi:hypothetical protein
MLACWRIPNRFRSWVALSAAYGVALQLLLVGFAFGTFSLSNTPDQGFSICHNSVDQSPDGHDNPAQNKNHELCCVACPLAGFGDVPIASAAQPIRFPLVASVTFSGFLSTSGGSSNDHDPRSSHGPPQLA